jgi:excisionase family DNA binding protein
MRSDAPRARKTRLQLFDERQAMERSLHRLATDSTAGAPSNEQSPRGRANSRSEAARLELLDPGEPAQEQNVPLVAVSVENAARALGVSRTTAWELVRAGRLPAKRIGSRVLIRLADISTFIAEQPNYP